MVKMWSKKETQKFMKRLRTAGFDVQKISEGHYKAFDGDVQVFSALNGMRHYMCNLNNDYFQEPES